MLAPKTRHLLPLRGAHLKVGVTGPGLRGRRVSDVIRAGRGPLHGSDVLEIRALQGEGPCSLLNARSRERLVCPAVGRNQMYRIGRPAGGRSCSRPGSTLARSETATTRAAPTCFAVRRTSRSFTYVRPARDSVTRRPGRVWDACADFATRLRRDAAYVVSRRSRPSIYHIPLRAHLNRAVIRRYSCHLAPPVRSGRRSRPAVLGHGRRA